MIRVVVQASVIVGVAIAIGADWSILVARLACVPRVSVHVVRILRHCTFNTVSILGPALTVSYPVLSPQAILGQDLVKRG